MGEVTRQHTTSREEPNEESPQSKILPIKNWDDTLVTSPSTTQPTHNTFFLGYLLKKKNILKPPPTPQVKSGLEQDSNILWNLPLTRGKESFERKMRDNMFEIQCKLEIPLTQRLLDEAIDVEE